MVFEEIELAAERERIAKDLHEGVLHTLFGVGLDLQWVAQGTSDDGAARRLEGCIERLDDAIADLRAYVFSRDVGEPNEQELG